MTNDISSISRLELMQAKPKFLVACLKSCFFGCGEKGDHYCIIAHHCVGGQIDERIIDLNQNFGFHQCPVCLIRWCCVDNYKNCTGITLITCNDCEQLSKKLIAKIFSKRGLIWKHNKWYLAKRKNAT